MTTDKTIDIRGLTTNLRETTRKVAENNKINHDLAQEYLEEIRELIDSITFYNHS